MLPIQARQEPMHSNVSGYPSTARRRSLLPLRCMPLQPPACGTSSLREDRPATALLHRAGPVVLDLVSLERCGQKLIDRDGAIGRAMRETDAQHRPVSRIKQRQGGSQHHPNSSQPSHPIPSVPQRARLDLQHCTSRASPAFRPNAGRETSRETIGNISRKTIGLFITA
jgi:hypothetical protein